jgi:hypothetical protein
MWTQTLNLGSSTWSLTQSSNGRLSIFDAPSGTGNERFSILSTGNVGIGTTSPSSKLSVYGDVHIEGTNRYLNFGTTTGSSGYGIRDNNGDLEFKNLNGSWTGIGTGSGGGGGGSVDTAQMTRNTVQSISNDTYTKVLLNNTVFDNNNLTDPTTNNRINIRTAGKYLVIGYVYIGTGSSGKSVDASIYKNGSNIGSFNRGISSTNTDGTSFASAILDLQANDYLELYTYQNSGSSQNTDTTYPPRLSIVRLDGSSPFGQNGNDIYYATGSVIIGTSTSFGKLSIAGTYGSTLPLFSIASTTSTGGATSSFGKGASGVPSACCSQL